MPSEGNSCYCIQRKIFAWPLNPTGFGLFRKKNCSNLVTYLKIQEVSQASAMSAFEGYLCYQTIFL